MLGHDFTETESAGDATRGDLSSGWRLAGGKGASTPRAEELAQLHT